MSIHRSRSEDANTALAEAESAGESGSLEKLLEHVPDPAKQTRPPAQGGLRTAKVVLLDDRAIEIAFRGRSEPVAAEVDESVERALVALAMKNGDSVLVEVEAGLPPLVVGVLQTRVPKHVAIKGETVTIEAEREVVLRTGEAAVRIREDGEVEVVGSRIHTLSRGLFRIVGRVLRLN